MADRSAGLGFFKKHDPIFSELVGADERAFSPDPATIVLKLRQLGEAFAKHAAVTCGFHTWPQASQLDLLRALETNSVVEGKKRDSFHHLRCAGNRTAHEFTADPRIALDATLNDETIEDDDSTRLAADWTADSGPQIYRLWAGGVIRAGLNNSILRPRQHTSESGAKRRSRNYE